MKLTFLGAADSVTGSKHLLDTGEHRILLDCGLYQGFKHLRERNWARLPVEPRDIDAVVLSHAHLDHSGYLPALVKHGFRGPVYATAATCDLARLMLLDSAKLQEEDAQHANEHRYSKHHPALPLYTMRDAHRALGHLKPLGFGQAQALGPHVQCDLLPAGHLLGAAIVRLRMRQHTLVFSGDLGRAHDLLMPPPAPVRQADVLLVESTYGDRRHPDADAPGALARIVRETAQRGGKVLMPTFAVGRAQALLLSIHRLKQAGEIPRQLPVYLDSPMASEATRVYARHRSLMRMPADEIDAMCEGVTFVETPEQSAQVTRSAYPAIVLAASGMATGGRVLHHLKAVVGDDRHHIVFPGFQVPGTRGAKLVGGAREIKIHGEYWPVRAPITQLEGLSGHADADELMAWLKGFEHPPAKVYVVHGEPSAADALRSRIQDELGWRAQVPEHGSTVTL